MDLLPFATDGLISTAELGALGLGPNEIARLRHAGILHRMLRGWYAVCSPLPAPRPWEGADTFAAERCQHLWQTRAFVRSFAGRVRASHQSALVLHGVAVWQSTLDWVHLERAGDDHSRHRPGAILHPFTGLASLTRHGIAVVPVATAVVQVGLAHRSDPVDAQPFSSLVAADNALSQGLLSPTELEEEVARHTSSPGIRAVRSLLKHADGRHESVPETRLAHTMRALRRPYTPQVEITARGRTYRVDGLLACAPVVLEVDGLVKYVNAESPDVVSARRIVREEKSREDDIRSLGYEFVRFGAQEVGNAAVVGRAIEAAIERSRTRPKVI